MVVGRSLAATEALEPHGIKRSAPRFRTSLTVWSGLPVVQAMSSTMSLFSTKPTCNARRDLSPHLDRRADDRQPGAGTARCGRPHGARCAAAARMGHDVVEVYRDHAVSGSKGRDKRPGFDNLHRAATRRRFDLVMAWSVDRLGRSLWRS